MPRRRVFITSATGALSTRAAPVGGGVAVLEALLPHLAAADDLDVTLLVPGAAGGEERVAGARRVTLPLACLAGRPDDHLLALGERAYARFALEWEAALGAWLDGVDPAGALVVANDVSEGPPFAQLARRGFAQLVLYHVVVGAFFARQYLRGPLGALLPAPRAARLWRAARGVGLARAAPRLLELVWEKEEQAARCGAAVVPSQAMADELAALYPASGVAARTHVVPWGVIGPPAPAAAPPTRRARRADVLRGLALDPSRAVLLTLSRISREKRLALLLRALRRLEREAPDLAERTALVVAGGPAYMGGAATLARLRRAAARLERVEVRFAGYVADDAKWDLLAAADLFCSTSRYEAYGLALAQALAAGTPALATDHQGARAILGPPGAGLPHGRAVPATSRALAAALHEALERPHPDARASAARWGAEHAFEHAAARLLELFREA